MQGIKQIILIRRDLRMRRGKEIAQGAHAAMAFLREKIHCPSLQNECQIVLSTLEQTWIFQNMAKICLQVHSEVELKKRHQQAIDAGLQSHLIIDSGRTEFAGNATVTACAIGPDLADKIDIICGDLKLY